MLTVKKYNELIEDYLKENYHPKVYVKHYDYYLLVVEELLLLYCSDYGLKNHNNKKKCQAINPNFTTRVSLGKYGFNLHYEDFKDKYRRRISTKYLNGHHDYDCKDINLFNVIKKDLIRLGILVKTKIRQPLIRSEKYSQEQFTLDLSPSTGLFTTDKVEFEFRGEFERNKQSRFIFEIEDLMDLSLGKQISPRKFLQNYFLLMTMNDEGFHIKTIEEVGRKHHSLSRVSEVFRAIVTPQNGHAMMNFDLTASHLFWLAELRKSYELYKDLKNGSLRGRYKKQTINEWLNSSNYEATKYKGITELFFIKYGIDTTNIRDEKGSLYSKLGKLESMYIQSISEQLYYDNYTMHDQIYFDEKGYDDFVKLVKQHNRKLRFEPIWKSK